MKARGSLYRTLGLIIVTIVVIIMSINLSHSYIHTKGKLEKGIDYNSKVSLEQLKNSISTYIESYSPNEYDKLVFNEMGHKDVFAIVIEDYNMGKILGQKSYISGKIRNEKWDITDYDPLSLYHKKLLSLSPLYIRGDVLNNDGKKIGSITIYSSDRFMNEELENMIVVSILTTTAISLILIGSLFFTIRYILLQPLSNIINTIKDRDNEGVPKKALKIEGAKEINTLASTMNIMIDTIKDSRVTLKESKEKLKDSEFRWKFAVEGSGDGLWDWDILTNEVYFSDQWKVMLGFEPHEIIHNIEEWDKRVHPDDKAKAYKDLQKHLKGKTQFYVNEHRLKCKNGEYKWILDRGIVVQKDKEGNPIRMLGTHTDITHAKEAQQQLENQKKEFETIFKNSKDGIAIFDLESNFLNFNDAYLEMTGFNKEELLKSSCLDLIIPEDKKKAQKVLAKVKRKGDVSNFETAYHTKDDKTITINMSISMMPDKKRMLATTKDVTESKVLESQAKLASMGEMIGNIAHQWRQPLNIITTSASGLMLKSDFKEEITPNDIQEFGTIIIDQAKYLSKTIDDFKNFIKDNDNKKRDIEISLTIEKTLSILNPSFVNNNITLVKDIKEDSILKGFENELIQALINIINNSKDALKQNIINEDERFIFISTKKEGDNFIIELKDSGGGIEKDIIDKVFEPYFTTKHQSIGTGIGLSMAYKIIKEHHNGSIEVCNDEYEYGGKKFKGALFKVIIPLNNTKKEEE